MQELERNDLNWLHYVTIPTPLHIPATIYDIPSTLIPQKGQN